MRKLTVILTSILIFVVLALTGAGLAKAGNCTVPTLCGTVQNVGDVNLTVRENFGTGPGRVLTPGESSDTLWADTDQFYVPRGYCARVVGAGEFIRNTPGWARITDNFDTYHVALHNINSENCEYATYLNDLTAA